MADVAIRAAAVASVPRDYTIPGAQEILPKSVSASMDGSGASASWYPCLQVLDPGGNVMFSAVAFSPIAAGASADVSWFPHLAPQTAVAATTGVVLDQFLVDSKTGTPTSGASNLVSGTTYVVTVQGTWSLWNDALEMGTPNANAMFPSSTAGRVSTQVGLDAECAFAFHDRGTGFTLGHKTLFKMSSGGPLVHVEPQGGPYALPQPNYLYTYSMTGTGVPLTAQMDDAGSHSDNYGKLQITIYNTTGSSTGGGAGALIPPDGSDYSVLQPLSGVYAWASGLDGGSA